MKATHAFQGRTDLLLRPMPHLSDEEIVRYVRDEASAAEASIGQPLHTAISYMLVSMECLIGAAYTRKVQAAGLAGRSAHAGATGASTLRGARDQRLLLPSACSNARRDMVSRSVTCWRSFRALSNHAW